MRVFAALILLTCSVSIATAEFPIVLSEPNLEKRSELALKEAAGKIAEAKAAYDQNTLEDFRLRVNEISELVNLSYKSLVDTGKRARNKPKYWKRADLQIRGLLRRLDSLAAEVALDDRNVVTSAHTQISDVHDQVLHDVMTKK